MANHLVSSGSGVMTVPRAVIKFAIDKTMRFLQPHDSTHSKVVLKGSNIFMLNINSKWFYFDTDVEIDTATGMDTGSIANGKDYYVYVCDNAGALVYLISLASTYPDGYDANTSYKIGGFHTLCVNAGTISGHTLTGYTANDILPESVWDVRHRPKCSPEGMVYCEAINKWVDIYLQSGTNASTASVYNATITDTRVWNDHVDDGHAVLKRLLTDEEFQAVAAGSNEETNITGSADPVTTGGHADTASRRMISNIGCEDCCGAMYQWLLDQSFRLDGASGGYVAAEQTYTVTYVETPGGNQVYVKFDTDGNPYLCCNMANDTTDKVITFGTDYKVIIKHDANASSGGLAVYFDDDAEQPGRVLVNNTVLSKDCYVCTNDPTLFLRIVHDADAASNGTALNYDDDSDERLESTCAGAENAAIDLAIVDSTAPSWAWYNLPGSKGSLYRQGTYGDIKLRAGGDWNHGASCGSRCRGANYYRWIAVTVIGARFLAEPL